MNGKGLFGSNIRFVQLYEFVRLLWKFQNQPFQCFKLIKRGGAPNLDHELERVWPRQGKVAGPLVANRA